MSRKRKQEAALAATDFSNSKHEGTVKLKPRGFVPRPCTSCTAIRPPDTNYSYVYHTAGRVRYCKCRFCDCPGWTQVISADLITSRVVHAGQNIMKETESMPSLVHGVNSIVTVTD